MKILIIDFAEQVSVLANNGREGLSNHYHAPDDIVDIINLLDLVKQYESDRNSTLVSKDSERLQKEYDLIYVTAHGLIDNIEYCFTNIYGGSTEYRQLFNANELATFLIKFFNDNKIIMKADQQNMTLCICYSARTINHMEDHQKNAFKLNFKQSFAYNFTENMRRQSLNDYTLVVNSYTGPVRFNKEDGQIEIGTENYIKILREIREINIQIGMVEPKLKEAIESSNAKDEENLLSQYNQLTKEKSDLQVASCKLMIRDYGCVRFKTTQTKTEVDISLLEKAQTIRLEPTPSANTSGGPGHCCY